MRRMGLKTVLLSGDTQGVTASVGQDLGVDESVGELLPDQKARWVRDLRAKGRNVAMVGDGINDAPALVEANVGIAMGSGTEVARESADVILIGSDLSKFVDTLLVARRCRGIIMQNFVGTLGVDSVGVGMAAFGLLNPLLERSFSGIGIDVHLEFNQAVAGVGRSTLAPVSFYAAGIDGILGSVVRRAGIGVAAGSERLRAGDECLQGWNPYSLPNWMLRTLGLLIIGLDALIALQL